MEAANVLDNRHTEGASATVRRVLVSHRHESGLGHILGHNPVHSPLLAFPAVGTSPAARDRKSRLSDTHDGGMI